ncbi:hypothetical protein LCGC14_0285710 [marine sediment metagenome]|uniref:protein-glutamate methylesterase n=1 Tax=marine sediment metagenome TaxID=412755 RepID=A0A0F9X062_9ZZZZ
MKSSANWSPFVSDRRAGSIALLASQPAKRQLLAEVLEEFGYRVVFAGEPDGLDCEQLAAVDTEAWLLELADESDLAEWLLEYCPVPVLLGAGEIPENNSDEYPRWKLRLYNKLLPLLGRPAAGRAPTTLLHAPAAVRQHNARCVWVLAASLGGPAAVKNFLDHLPADLPVAFIYAQHIDARFEEQLPQILGRHNGWRIINCRQGANLHEGEVLVAPISQSLGFGTDGSLQLSATPWPGPYQPAIEVMLDEASNAFGPACGAIIFSGMGEDGVQACGRMRRQGMEVWTQSAHSAACAVMPQAVQLAGHSSRQGSPVELAGAMRHWLEQEWPVAL